MGEGRRGWNWWKRGRGRGIATEKDGVESMGEEMQRHNGW